MERNELTTDLNSNGSTSDTADSRNLNLEQQFEMEIHRHILESYGKAQCYPALKFRQGKREMIQINVPAIEVPTLLKAKPSNDNDPNSGKNRPLDAKHADGIKEYISHRANAEKPWILGTLTANVAKEKIEIVPIWRDICLVKIPRGVFLEITDGQHRTKAMQQLIMSEGDERDLISNDSFAITLVLEDDLRQCQTDFRDMAQTKTLPPALLVSYGGLGRDGIAQILVDECPMFRNKTQKIKTSPGSGSKFIYTSNFIAKAVGCAFTNNPNNELLNYNVDESAELLNKHLNLFFSECSHTKHIFLQDELKPDEATNFKEICLLGMSVGLEVLGRLMNCCYDNQNNSFEETRIFELTQLNWSRESELWRNNVVRLDNNPKDPKKPFKISASATSVSMAVKQAKEKLEWVTS